jgi:hypothetical protein
MRPVLNGGTLGGRAMSAWILLSVTGLGVAVLLLGQRFRSNQRRLAHLTADATGLTIGPGDQIPWTEVIEVRVETTDAGPYDEDLFLVVIARGRAALRIPSSIVPRVLPQVQRLPGFDNETFIKSMSCTDKAVFVCWRTPN